MFESIDEYAGQFNPVVLIKEKGLVIDRETGELLNHPGLVLKSISDRGPPDLAEARVCSVQVGVQDVIIRKTNRHTQSKMPGGIRGEIKILSPKSQQRMLLSFRNTENLKIMLTLTYPREFPTDGRIVKRDWSAMRKWLARRGVGGCWFLEFQNRGAPHIHCFLNNPADKNRVAAAWFKIVGSGDDRHLRAGTRVEWLRCPTTAAGVYAAKYGAKATQKEVPEDYRSVGRFWGYFGKCRPGWVWTAGEEWRLKKVLRVVRKAHRAKRLGLGLSVRECPGCQHPTKPETVGYIAWGLADASMQKIIRDGLPIYHQDPLTVPIKDRLAEFKAGRNR